MKTYINIILTILVCNIALAQETIKPLQQLGIFNEEPNTTYYYKDINNDLDKFVGTWIYNNGSINFTIKFYKLNHYQSGTGDFYDKIYSKIKFINNGVIVYDTLNEFDYNHSDISGADLFLNDVNKLGLTYRESSGIPVTSIPSVDLEYLPCTGLGCQPQLNWHNTYLKETAEEPWPFVIPTDMILTKQ